MNERKRHVLEVSMQLFAEKGFHQTSIQDILEHAKISKGTFYNYFSSKNECLSAILDISQHDSAIRKRSLQVGKSISDKSVFAAQIATFMHVHKDYNLLPIIESIFHSGDEELKKVVKKHHSKEVKWLATRVLDIYGEKAFSCRYDIATLLLALINHIVRLGLSLNIKEVTPDKACEYAIRQMDRIVPDMIHSNDSLLGPGLEQHINSTLMPDKIYTHAHMLERVIGFKNRLSNEATYAALEYVDTLIEELQREKTRYFILNTIAFQFSEAFRNTKHAIEAIEIASHIWEIVNEAKTNNLEMQTS